MSNLQASTKIAGTYYYEAEELLKSKRLSTGMSVVVRREPSNQYDDNAIVILHENGSRIGYFPKRLASTLAPLMDSGMKISAKVKEIRNRDGKLFVSVNLKYTNLHEIAPPPVKCQAVPRANTPTLSKPVYTPVRKTLSPKSRPAAFKSQNAPARGPMPHQPDTEGGSAKWWIWGVVVVVAIIFLKFG